MLGDYDITLKCQVNYLTYDKLICRDVASSLKTVAALVTIANGQRLFCCTTDIVCMFIEERY